MELTVNIQYEQLINIIRHLPANQLAKIKTDIENSVIVSKMESERTDFQQFLLKGPVMSDVQYTAFKENRKAFNQWRSK
jgi:3-methyladenine DNA glycosylase Tag